MADNFHTLDQASITSAGIIDGTIVDADINASAAIAQSKIADLTTDLAAKVAKSTLTTKGDIYAATAASTPARLAVGADYQLVMADSSKTTGMRYASAQEIGGYAIPEDHGYVGWTMPATSVSTSNALLSTETAAGVLNLVRIRRVPAASITDIVIYIATAGATLSNCGAAVYTSAGALVGQTADMSTPWQSTGLKEMSLTGGPYATSAGDLYAALWWNGTTAPRPLYSSGFSGALTNAGLSAANSLSASSDSGITTTAPATLGTKSARATYWWVALKGTRS